MHCCLLLITREMPSENRISEILKPYDEENLECDKTGKTILMLSIKFVELILQWSK